MINFRGMTLHLRKCQRILVLKKLTSPTISHRQLVTTVPPRSQMAPILLNPSSLMVAPIVHPHVPHRQLVTTTLLRMPRKGRLQLAEEMEEEAGLGAQIEDGNQELWADYSRGKRGALSGDFASITAFGSIRMDRDNVPREFESNFEKHKFPSGQGFSEKGGVSHSDICPSDYLGLPTGENFEQFEKFKPLIFGDNKNTQKKKDGRRFAFDHPLNSTSPDSVGKLENQTIPVSFGVEAISESSQSVNTDLNYFDEIIFKESYDNFKSDIANSPQVVKLDPAVMLAKEQTMERDLNFIDKNYFSQPISQELNFGDTSAKSEPQSQYQVSEENIIPEAVSKYEYDLVPVEEEKPAKVEKPKVKASKKREKARLSTEGTALEYVRKLRKISDVTAYSETHPKEMLGKHLQDRMLSAASYLQKASTAKKVDNEDIEEEGDGNIVNFVDVKKYKPPDLLKYSRMEVKDVLLSKIIYDNHDIVAIWKPYGLPMFKTKKILQKRENLTHSMECFLPDIAAKVKCESLHEVHRLDATTTGVLLYAKTKEMELKLRKLFAERKIKKNYVAVCNGTPQADSGVIDIPIGDGRIGGKVRKTLRPDYNSSRIVTNKKTSDMVHEDAVTEYTVLASVDNASFVATHMQTGRKHQIRLHLGLGLGVPILGDHKFSYPTEIGKPQKVHGDILQKLKLKKSKSRHLPIYLHARRITVPNILPNGNDLVVVATLPHFFSKTLQKLKLKTKHY